MTTHELLVNTTTGTPIPTGCVLITANLRTTDDRPVADEERYRNIVIPEFSILSVPAQFQSILLAKLYELAKLRFESAMKDSNRMLSVVPADDYTISSLLAWFATHAASGRLSKESVTTWFLASATYALVLDRKGTTEAQKWVELFAKLASPNHGVNPNTCRILLASLQPADLATDIGESIAGKLGATVAKSEQSQVEGL